MAENFPKATTPPERKPRRDYNNAIIGILAAGLLVVSGFLVYEKTKISNKQQQETEEITKADSEKSDLQRSFDASLARLDSISTVNQELQNQLADRNKEIEKVKSEIRSILNKNNASAAELTKARKLIASLNTRIADMEDEIAVLTEENTNLNNERTALIEERERLHQDLATTTAAKQELEKKVEIASTLNASNITITPYKIKRNGKEKVSDKAKRVDKLLVSFDVHNRIAEPGTTADVYVLVIDPQGNSMANGGEFTTREDGNKSFTAKVPVQLETTKNKNVSKNVSFSFVPGTRFKKGNYTVKIYQNGFLIGEGKRELKTSGFS